MFLALATTLDPTGVTLGLAGAGARTRMLRVSWSPGLTPGAGAATVIFAATMSLATTLIVPKDYDCAIATPNSAAAIAASKLIPPSVPTAAARFAWDAFCMSGVIQ